MTKPSNRNQLPLYVVVLFGLIAPLFMGYAAYDIGSKSLYHQALVDKLTSDGISTTARITSLGPCKGSGREPIDCWISYEFQANERIVRRDEVRVGWSENRSYSIGKSIKITYVAQSPQQSTHRTLAAHKGFASSNFWAAIGCVVFILALLYIATRQLIGLLLTHALALLTAALCASWFTGMLVTQ
jgi:hypothetical protein